MTIPLEHLEVVMHFTDVSVASFDSASASGEHRLLSDEPPAVYALRNGIAAASNLTSSSVIIANVVSDSTLQLLWRNESWYDINQSGPHAPLVPPPLVDRAHDDATVARTSVRGTEHQEQPQASSHSTGQGHLQAPARGSVSVQVVLLLSTPGAQSEAVDTVYLWTTRQRLRQAFQLPNKRSALNRANKQLKAMNFNKRINTIHFFAKCVISTVLAKSRVSTYLPTATRRMLGHG